MTIHDDSPKGTPSEAGGDYHDSSIASAASVHDAASAMSRPPFKHHESSERSERALESEADEAGALPPLLAEVTLFVVPGKLDLREVYERIDALGGERVLEPDDARIVVTGLRGVPRLERALGPNLVSRRAGRAGERSEPSDRRAERAVQRLIGASRTRAEQIRLGRE